MSITVEAVYRDGNLLLRAPLPLEEDQPVSVTISVQERNGNGVHAPEIEKPLPDPERVAQILSNFVSEAKPTGQVDTGSIDHDHYLYGARRQSETDKK